MKQYVVLRLKFCLLYTVCAGETPHREKEIGGGCPEGEQQQENYCVYQCEVICIGNLAIFQKVSARQPQYGERQQPEKYATDSIMPSRYSAGNRSGKKQQDARTMGAYAKMRIRKGCRWTAAGVFSWLTFCITIPPCLHFRIYFYNIIIIA